MRQYFPQDNTNYNPKHVSLDIRDQMIRAEYVRLLFSKAAFAGWWMYDRRDGAIIRYNAIISTLQDIEDHYPINGVEIVAEGHHSNFVFLGIDNRTKSFYRWLGNRDAIIRQEAEKKKAPENPRPFVFRYRVAG